MQLNKYPIIYKVGAVARHDSGVVKGSILAFSLLIIMTTTYICNHSSGVLRIFQWGEVSVTLHRDDVQYYVILRHHDVTPLAVSI